MDALRNTINTQSIKTKQIVFQYPDGSFPEPGAILNITDTRGHTDWTRAPNLDSITLVDASGNEGVVTYTDASGLLVNNVPVGGGGGSVTGGTNIQVSGLGVVSFDPTGGVDMLGAPMTNATQIGFTDSGKNATLLFDSTSTNGTLTLTNTTNTPQLSISAGAAASILTSTEASTKTNTITMSTSGANGTSTIAMTDGTTNAAVSYTEVNDQLTVSCSENLSIVAANSAHTIEMGTALGQVLVSTKDDPIVLARSDPLPSTAIQTVLKMDTIGVVQVGDAGVLTDPGLRFQGALNDATVQLDDATNVLNVTSVTNAPLQLNVPLNDGTGVAGTAGQVLTSQGAGTYPVWATSGTPVILESATYTTPLSTPIIVTVDNSNFSSIPVSASSVTVQFTLQGGGGGGGGGLGIGFPPAGGVMTSGGGGGGGAGYIQTVTVTVNYGSTFTYTIGGGGGGGGGAQILLGSSDAGAGSPGGNTTVTMTSGSYTANGGGGGGGGSSSGGAQAGGAGSSPGSTGSFTFSGAGASGGDDGAGIVFGGAGGGTNGGLGGTSAGGAYGSPDGPTLPAMQGGQGVPSAANSGDGGGGGSGGAGGYGQAGGPGAPGYVKIDILSFV